MAANGITVKCLLPNLKLGYGPQKSQALYVSGF